MSEQQEVVTELGDAGVLAGVHWAYLSATRRTLATYSEADGHDATWLGSTRHTLFRDRLDRVFACMRYAVRSDHENADLDLLYAELSERDIDTMPVLDPLLVQRKDLNGSPGWAYGQVRFLLASCDFGKLHQLSWSQKSSTKQRVARQRDPEPPQPSLFEDLTVEEAGGLEALAAGVELDLTTFVVGHTLDSLSHQIELVFGRPSFNAGGGDAWRWSQDLLDIPLSGGGRRADSTPVGPAPDAGPKAAPDADVRLREDIDEPRHQRDGGEA